MAELPQATTRLVADAGARAAGLNNCVIIGCVLQNADGQPRVYAGAKAIHSFHGYAPGVDYAAKHIQETGKPVIFVGVPVVTAGTVGQIDQSGNSDTCVVTVAAGSGGSLDEADGRVRVSRGGTIGTDQIQIEVSLDGGRTWKKVNLGTGDSYTIPYVNHVLSFGAGDLTEGETVLTWKSTAPLWDSAGLELARAGLASKQLQARTWMVIGDLPDADAAADVVSSVNAYETSNKRFVTARAQVYDRPSGKLSTTGMTLTFTAADDTVVRESGSWLADGFRVGDTLVISGSSDNDGSHVISSVTATDLVVGASPGFVDETIEADEAGLSITSTVSKTAHVAEAHAEFEDIDGENRINLGFGRGYTLSPFTGYRLRRPVQWAASIREYQHDVHVPTWQNKIGPLSGWSLEAADGSLSEHNETVDGGALAARFTCFRTWENGPNGAFIALDLTREDENSVLSYHHAMSVANVACTLNQQSSEKAVGETPPLNPDGTAQSDALARIKARNDSALERGLLRDFGEGARASNAYWTPNTTDDLSGVGGTLRGVLSLFLLGTIVNIDTEVRVNPSGA